MIFAPGFAKTLIFLLSGGGLFSGGLMGLPPGDRDPAFLKCAPAESLIYSEWAARSTGKPGAPGIDGLAADPEVQAFLKKLDEAILTMIDRETADGNPQERILGKTLPPLIKSLLMRPGCLYADVDAEAAAKALQAGEGPMPSWAGLLSGLRATLIVNAGEDDDALAKQIDNLIDLAALELPIEKTEGLKQQKIPLPMPGVELTIHRHQNYFIVGFGAGTVDAAVAGLSGETKGLADNGRFEAALKQVSMERTAGVTWIDVKGLLAKASRAMGPQGEMISGMAKMTGADAVDAIVTSTGVVDGQIRTKSFAATGGETGGVLALAAGRAITADDLALVPADADFLLAGSLNAPKILAAVRQIVGDADPPSRKGLEDFLQQLETELGVSLEEDVFRAFGDVWTLYDSPSAGGLLLTAPVLSLEVRDAEKAKEVLARLMKVVDEALPGEQGNEFRRRGVFLEQAKFLDRTIYYINTVGDDDIPVAPSLCLTDDQLLVTMHPQPLKAHLRFLKEKQAGFASRIGGDIELSAGELLSLNYVDAKTLIGSLYGLTPWIGQALFTEIQTEHFELDVFSLPSARAILPYVGTSLSTTVRTKEGILIDSRSALPIPGASAGLLSLPMTFFGVGTLRGVRGIRIQKNIKPAAPAAVRAGVFAKPGRKTDRRKLPRKLPARLRRLAP